MAGKTFILMATYYLCIYPIMCQNTSMQVNNRSLNFTMPQESMKLNTTKPTLNDRKLQEQTLLSNETQIDEHTRSKFEELTTRYDRFPEMNYTQNVDERTTSKFGTTHTSHKEHFPAKNETKQLRNHQINGIHHADKSQPNDTTVEEHTSAQYDRTDRIAVTNATRVHRNHEVDSTSRGLPSQMSDTSLDERNTTPYNTDSCPDECECDVWEKRDGIVVNCSNRNLIAIPEVIPNQTVYINLKSNVIGNIESSSFAKWNTKTIQKLNLAHNNISAIHPEAFKNFNHLWEINLASNQLKQINNIRFPFVHELNVENNQIEFNATLGFDKTGFKSYAKGNNYCEVIYRRNTKPIDESWENLENVKQIMIKLKCTEKLHECNGSDSVCQNVQTNHSELVSSTKVVFQSMPSTQDMAFYGAIMVVFLGLILFLVSQSYNHAWIKCVRKRVSRRNTRDHIINVHPQPHRRQSQKTVTYAQKPV